jgi:hypothetical protein
MQKYQQRRRYPAKTNKLTNILETHTRHRIQNGQAIAFIFKEFVANTYNMKYVRAFLSI